MGKSKTGALVIAAAFAVTFSALAQTPAPPASPAESPAAAAPAPVSAEDVSKGFVEGMTLCAKAAFRKQSVAQLPQPDRALVRESNQAIRDFVQAQPGMQVFDVVSAAGVVILTERERDACEVLAYGPPVRPTFARAGEALVGLRMGYLETENGENASEIVRTYERVSATGEKVTVSFVGAEPGMQGRDDLRYPLFNVVFERSGGAQPQN